jgi:hypothetical protein
MTYITPQRVYCRALIIQPFFVTIFVLGQSMLAARPQKYSFIPGMLRHRLFGNIDMSLSARHSEVRIEQIE